MDHEQINAVILANNAAVAAGDIDAVLATFEDGGTLVGQPGQIAAGQDALRAAFAGFMAIAPQITVKDHNIIQSGDIALHASTWDMVGAAPDGSEIRQSGFSTVVLRKQADGAWLMVIDNPFGDLLLQNS